MPDSAYGFADGYKSGMVIEPEAIRKETLRYLGVRDGKPDEAVEAMVRETGEWLSKNAVPAAFWRRYPLSFAEGSCVVGSHQLPSAHLRKNLEGCTSVMVLAATLGAGTDRMLYRLGLTNVTKQVIMQSASAAYLEEFLDRLQADLADKAFKEGLSLRPRFSPGYGDLALENQHWIIGELETEKRLGIVLSEGMLMIPSKSVTALIGIRPDPEHREFRKLHNCAECGMTDCAFRRE